MGGGFLLTCCWRPGCYSDLIGRGGRQTIVARHLTPASTFSDAIVPQGRALFLAAGGKPVCPLSATLLPASLLNCTRLNRFALDVVDTLKTVLMSDLWLELQTFAGDGGRHRSALLAAFWSCAVGTSAGAAQSLRPPP